MVDLGFLEKFTKGDTQKMKRYINLYIELALQTFQQMQKNIEEKDWEQLRINAHSLKPQADFMGIPTLKNALISIEEAAKTNKKEIIYTCFERAKKLSIDAIGSLKEAEKHL